MKKKGFTLIELLAVIIILAIVALIATPTILDVIENARRSAFEQSARGYYKATEYIYNEMFLDGDTQDINFTFKDGVQTSSNPEYKLEVSGEKPKGGLVYLFKDGRIMLSIHNNKYCANVDHEGKVSISEDINDCTSGITEIPSECFSITSETVDSVSYNMLDYDRTNPNCSLEIDTLIIPSEVNGQPVEGIGSYAFHHTRGKVSTHNQKVSVNNVIIPEGVKVIKNQAFYNSGLINVVLPGSVTSMGTLAFSGNQLTNLIIPNGVTSIGNSAFAASKITSVTIPDSVTSIGNGAFNSNQLTNVTIPSSVTSIGSNAFRNNLLSRLDIPSSVTNIGAGAFTINQLPDDQAFIYARNSDGTIDHTNLISYGGANKDNVIIPNSVTTIGRSVFSGVKLTSVTIPNSVTSIGTSAFSNNQLTSITIPSSVTTIESGAFKINNFADANAITIEGDSTRFDSNWTDIGFPEKPKTIAQTLLEQYSTSNTVGLLKDDTGYYYKGTNEEVGNNFLWFAGHLWRVISIDSDNNLTMITQQPLTSISVAGEGDIWTTQAKYEASYVNHWLNNEEDGVFYKSLTNEDKSKILNSTFNIGTYDNISGVTTTQKVGLLDETQYTKAGGMNSFLDIKDDWWLGTTYHDDYANYDYVYSINTSGSTYSMNFMSDAFGIRPVIKIASQIFSEGDGTLSNPFRERSTSTNTSDIKVGEYISVSTSGSSCGEDNKCLFRVVSKDNNSIKVTLNGLIGMRVFGSTTTYKSGNEIDNNVKYFAWSISNNYRYAISKTFGIGEYGSGANYTTVQNATYIGNFGLPVVGEMFSGNDIDMSDSEIKTFVNVSTIENPTISDNYWTMNARSVAYVCKIANGKIHDSEGNYQGGIRPVIFLKNNLTFTGGEGTAEHPFTLE